MCSSDLRLWGEIVPVPEDRLRVLRGGESLDGFRVEYTPGHASHHVAYFHEETATALCGDVAGARIGDGPLIAPTPPPDIDIAAWHESIDRIAAWRPRRLALTHWGSFEDAGDHLARLHEELDDAVAHAQRLDEVGYEAWMGRRFAAASETEAYLQATPAPTLYPGLARYLGRR